MANIRLTRLLGIAVFGTALASAPLALHAQWTQHTVSTTASLRGLSVVNQQVIWASGTGGSYLWTNDGGTTWNTGAVPGAATFDFRDVYAVSLDTVYLMAAGQDTARIYKTTDRGQHWTLQYDNTSPGAFLDAIAFWDATHGIALGDPINGHFLVLTTNDGGAHWVPAAEGVLPPSLPGEAAFAASGTALITAGAHSAFFATGGAKASRVFATHDQGKTWTVVETPVIAGASSKGIFSIAFADATHGIVVGGDYAKPDATATAAAYTDDSGRTWHAVPPSVATGYLSAVTYLQKVDHKTLVAVGTQGTAVSTDSGHTWTRIDSVPLNAVMAAPASNGHVVLWGVGERGAIYSRNNLDK